jgi:hypothetical protein
MRRMGTLLKKVIEKLEEMPPDEQDAYCAGLLKELEAIRASQPKLEALVAKARADIAAGRTYPMPGDI